ncbi:MAG: hypothetical protein LBD03_09960 [Methanobrevibacter sp.]|nr:hypothetical protein [Candidatus Methanovirga procula]
MKLFSFDVIFFSSFEHEPKLCLVLDISVFLMIIMNCIFNEHVSDIGGFSPHLKH